MSNKSTKRIPQYRAIALARSFAFAAKSGKPAKLISAIEATRSHDKEFKTNFIVRIANLIGQDISFTKRLKIGDLKPSNVLKVACMMLLKY